MTQALRSIFIFSALLFSACVSPRTVVSDAAAAAPPVPSCDLAHASPWIGRWFAAWDLTSREILRLPDAPPPNVILYDAACVYTTSEVTGAGSPAVDGPALRGTTLSWRAAAHRDSITLPNGSSVPVALMSFTNSDRRTGPFFVMALPPYWEQFGHDPNDFGLTAVFLHEFAHTRQVRGMAAIIGPIDDAWSFPEELTDDVVQERFGSDSAYAAAYRTERDLLYRAAAAESIEDVRTLAAEALAIMRKRHARWFTGENAVFATLDDTWLSMEGAAQWAGYAWLAHPEGGGLDRAAAVRRLQGRRRVWSQDEGMALFLVIDRLLPEWPSLVFGEQSIGATALLERAIER